MVLSLPLLSKSLRLILVIGDVAVRDCDRLERSNGEHLGEVAAEAVRNSFWISTNTAEASSN